MKSAAIRTVTLQKLSEQYQKAPPDPEGPMEAHDYGREPFEVRVCLLSIPFLTLSISAGRCDNQPGTSYTNCFLISFSVRYKIGHQTQ